MQSKKAFIILSFFVLLIGAFTGQIMANDTLSSCQPSEVTEDQLFIWCTSYHQSTEEINEDKFRSQSEAIYSKYSHKIYKYGEVFWQLLNADGTPSGRRIAVSFRYGDVAFIHISKD